MLHDVRCGTGMRLMCAAATVVMLAGSIFAQTALPPGATVAVPAIPGIGGSVVYDTSVPFSIYNAAGALLYSAKLQDRVAVEPSGNIMFECRVRDNTPGLNGIIATIERINFADDAISVFASTTSLGTTLPSSASRTPSPGTLASFRYSPGIFSNTESKFAVLRTDARDYDRNGVTIITLTTGESTAITTTQPATGTPLAIITGPTPFSCACSPITITGTANASTGFFNYSLDYSANPAGPWTNIVTSATPVTAGVLATWNTSSISSGDYFVRLTSRTTSGAVDEFVTMMRVDSSDPVAIMRSPVEGGIYGGVVCFDGTTSDNACFDRYTLGFRKNGTIPYNTFVNSNVSVINDPLGSVNLGAAVDGPYDVRLQVFDSCGRSSTVSRTIEIDNTAPVSLITNPDNCDSVDGLVPVVGTAFDRNISGWSLSYTGGDVNSFQTIATGTGNITNGVLGVWDTRELTPCCYTLRLSVVDRAQVNCSSGHQTDFYVSVDVGGYSCPADFNMDGGIDGSDVNAFFEAWSAGECQ